MNCANCSALLHRQKLIWSHLLSLLPLYCVLLGSFSHHRHHHFRHIVHVAHVARLFFSVLSVLSCFCLYCCYIIYCMLPLEVNKVVQNKEHWRHSGHLPRFCWHTDNGNYDFPHPHKRIVWAVNPRNSSDNLNRSCNPIYIVRRSSV